MEFNHISVGQNIMKFRIANKLTQKEFAKLTDLSPSYISHIECAEEKASINVLLKIAKAFNINVDSLIAENLIFSHNAKSDRKDSEYKNFCNCLECASINQKIAFLEILNLYKNKHKRNLQ